MNTHMSCGKSAASVAGRAAAVLLGAAVILSSCAGLRDLLRGRIEKPRVSLESAKVVGLSFTGADLLFDVRIENPNRTGLKLSGFDYTLFIDEHRLVRGTQDRETVVEPRGASVVQLPLAVLYEELFKALENAGVGGTARYRLDLGLRFDVPPLGETRVPVSAEGDVPVLRIPSLRLAGVRVSRLDFTEADLVLTVAVRNPNGFVFSLERFDFVLDVGGQGWASGGIKKKAGIAAGAETLVPVPVRVSTFFIGQSGYRQLLERRPLACRFRGSAAFSAPFTPPGGVELPFDVSGVVEVSR